ncbi:MAG: mitochondrial fission ELM1 family protein [Campylobacterales bacterium]|nr:mitochondrial fission ELM1 family protein [Campylobacterales bacterium]
MENLTALILSDKRAGHLNQSIAFCKHLNIDYFIVNVTLKYKFLTYIFDFLNIYTFKLFSFENFKNDFDMVISTGSNTYYANKTFAKKYNKKSVACMLPKGFKTTNFDLILAQLHDNPKKANNILKLPINLTYIEPKNIFNCDGFKYVAIVIGGNNSIFSINLDELKSNIQAIIKLFKEYKIAITTSPRTPKEIEDFIESLDIDYKLIYSKQKLNPIPDFLNCCEYVFITSDSTSMISEAVSFGKANIEIIMLEYKKENKFIKLIKELEKKECLHLFDGNIGVRNKKIELNFLLKGVFYELSTKR